MFQLHMGFLFQYPRVIVSYVQPKLLNLCVCLPQVYCGHSFLHVFYLLNLSIFLIDTRFFFPDQY